MTTTIILAAVLSLVIGAAIGYVIRNAKAVSELKEKNNQRDQIIAKAKEQADKIKYNSRREGKEIVKDLREEFDKEVRKKENKLEAKEKEFATSQVRFENKEKDLDKEKSRLAKREEEINSLKENFSKEKEKFKERQSEYAEKLTEVAKLTQQEAKNELLATMEDEAKVDFARRYNQIEEEYRENAENEGKKVISTAIQRFAGEYVAEKTISAVDLPSDDVKGRLIGREGRNIRAFEQICGVDLIIDDTPGVVVISSFNVIRKEIAKMTIENLIQDGRIHPARIAEYHDKAQKQMDKKVLDLGEKAQMEIGIHGIHPEVLKLVGALNFRTSYTQNQLQHALEAAMICGSMAAEMGYNVKQARRAGLLHDVGKVLDASAEGSHAVIGADFLKRYGESADIIHAVRAHHDDEKPQSVLAHLVAASDALSGARPGARKAMMESYVSRLTDIEQIVNGFEGVSKSYALSGGREVRVFVENDKVSDEETILLSRDIAKKIESEMSYPGTIKITVLRETKAVDMAR